MAINETTDLDYLIDDLRFYLGDSTEVFSDAELRHALVMGVKALMKRWRNRYKIDSNYKVTRNSTSDFSMSSPPVIEVPDEFPIIVQAAIIIKEAEMKDTVWDLASWKDDEISYSNLEGGRQARTSISEDRAFIEEWFKKRLFGTDRQSLPGFHYPLNFREGSRE